MRRALLASFAAAAITAAAWFWLKVRAEPEFEELDAASQEFIWEAEHVAFSVETRFGKPLCKALKAKSAEQMVFGFEPGAAITIAPATLDAAPQAEFSRSIVKQRDFAAGTPAANTPAAGTPSKGGPPELAAWFLESLADFEQVRRASLRVLHNYAIEPDGGVSDSGTPPQQIVGWRIESLITLVGTRRGGGWIEAVSKHDFDIRFDETEDISDGGKVDRWHVRSLSLRESPAVLFEEATEGYQLHVVNLRDNWRLPAKSAEQFTFQIAVEDFDRDGFLDIAVAAMPNLPILLRSVEGRKFEDVTARLGLTPWEYDERQPPFPFLSWIDFDNDGFPDLLLGNRLHRNEQGRRFVDVTESMGFKTKARDPMGSIVGDYDGDGRLDLYLLYQGYMQSSDAKPLPYVGDNVSGEPNELWRNEGGQFRDVTEQAAASGGPRNSFAAVWLYLDEDHHPDLYVANDFGRNSLFKNRGDGTFEDVTDASLTGEFATSMGVAAGDLDDDGTPEIYVANMFSKMGRRIIAHVDEHDYPPGVYDEIRGSCAGNRLFRREGAGPGFTEFSTEAGVNEVGWAFAPAMEDFDGDGRLDLYASTGFMSFNPDLPDG